MARPRRYLGQGLVRNRPVVDGAPLLGHYAEDLIRDAVAKGFLAK